MSSVSTEPGGRDPAPEPLRHVQRFVNSNDREAGRDALDSPAGLARWIRQARLGTARDVDERGRIRAVELRESLRSLLLANNGAPPDERALATLDAEAERTGVAVRFTAIRPRLEPGRRGLDGVLGQLVAIVFEAMLDGTWPRLKACRRDVCQWAFYDHSRNRSGTWCTMDVCGNRVKTSAYWQRRHTVR